jgi:capsular exopolysaccharide synthesis family protein
LFENFDVAERFATGGFVLRFPATGGGYALETTDGIVLEQGEQVDSVGYALGFRWQIPPDGVVPGQAVAFRLQSLRDVSRGLAASLQSSLAKDGNFLRLAFTGTDPQHLARVLNAISDQFIAVAAGQKQMQLIVQAEALRQQLDIARQNLADAETRLQRYGVETITLPREVAAGPMAAGLSMTQGPVLANYFDQKLQLNQIELDMVAIGATMDGIREGTLRMDALLAIPAVLASQDLSRALSDLSAAEANLRALQQRFTDQHRLVQDERDRIAVLRDETIPPYVDGLIAQLNAQRAALSRQIDAMSIELQEIPVRTITEQRLEREKISAEKLFQTLQNNYAQTSLSLQSAIPDVRPLDPATPPTRPSSSTVPMTILTGFIVGLAGSMLLALLLDHMDTRFRYPEEVSDDLGLTILGAIPAIKKLKTGKQSAEEASQVVEAFRTVRLGLAHSYGSAGPVLLTITSPGPGDGKSLVSSNLALSFAEASYRTLLIDGDIRRGELHRMFDINRQPGLLDYLVGDADISAVLRRAKTHRNLSVIASGTRRHMGPELLSSPAMGTLMAELKGQFDAIIVDSPPLGAGIDPFVLSTLTGNLLMVLRSGETDRQMAEEKLKVVDRLPIRILGAVLNDVKTSQRAYKYYSYVYSYTPDDESVTSLPALSGSKD